MNRSSPARSSRWRPSSTASARRRSTTALASLLSILSAFRSGPAGGISTSPAVISPRRDLRCGFYGLGREPRVPPLLPMYELTLSVYPPDDVSSPRSRPDVLLLPLAAGFTASSDES